MIDDCVIQDTDTVDDGYVARQAFPFPKRKSLKLNNVHFTEQ